MSLGDPAPPLSLPERFDDTTSWRRAQSEETRISPVSRPEWIVRVGDGDRHRVTFALDDGHPLADCDCRGFRARSFCAHVSACYLAWLRDEIHVSDVSQDPAEEVVALKRGQDRGGRP